MTERRTLALIAHDAKKDEMVAFAKLHESKLADYKLFATGTTGGRIQDACPSLDVERMKSGPLGGDQQIGAMIADRALDGLFFFVDPLSPMPHDVDVKALMRLALVYDIPMALNRSTADIILRSARLAGLSTSSQTPEISSQQ
ncbi:Methylglyoxal synthase [Pseudovibrio sp. W64]|uniref:methylglyoxal synthase n=1 Tax=unclassified Pseudovibrio TaxID=2627060 RepID=UPI0007AEB9D9|nr:MULTISPECIES: methylglyoxal synthase [unclassified Pseudovibrio]KZK75465.1 Methylglyoxal synthase [Pseudovibrio sp. W64]KZK85998.1 Methylglyoxal synthase [Pseudovibrio sp. Ad13]KZL01162.1 Methylglyoxal synthase [Pseudovibrio sp. W74]KZL11227.1 Methylglyoxal synthase [Pseudovibrio sp. Ad14]